MKKNRSAGDRAAGRDGRSELPDQAGFVTSNLQNNTQPPAGQLRVYSGLMALARHHGNELGLWLQARAHDAQGSGLVNLKEFRALAGAHFGKARFYRALSAGEQSGFWKIVNLRDGNRALLLTGIFNLAKNHGITNLGMPYVIEPECLSSAKSIRQAHFAALVSSRATDTQAMASANRVIGVARKAMTLTEDRAEKNKLAKLEKLFKSRRHYAAPISQAKLAEFGAPSRRTQSRYLVDLKSIWATKNTATTGLPGSALDWARDNKHGSAFYVRHGDLWRRLPNTYSTRMERCPIGRSKKLTGLLRALLLGAGGQHEQDRLFFNDAEKAVSANPSLDHFVLLPLRQRWAYPGMRRWAMYQAMD